MNQISPSENLSNLSFFSDLKEQTQLFNLYIDSISDLNFRVHSIDYAFPNFPLNNNIGLNTVLVKLKNNIEEIKELLPQISDNIKNIIYEQNYQINSNLLENIQKSIKDIPINSFGCVTEDCCNGMGHIGIFYDKDNNIYLGITSKLDDIVNFNNKFLNIAMQDTLDNLEVRYELLKVINQTNMTESNKEIVQQEFKDMLFSYYSFLTSVNLKEYLNDIDIFTKISILSNMQLLQLIIDSCNNLQFSDEPPITLNYISTDKKFINYYLSPLVDGSLVFYNVFDGFGYIKNMVADKSYLIPTSMISLDNQENIDKTDINYSDIKIDEMSVLNREHYHSSNFMSKEDILFSIHNHVIELDGDDINNILIFEDNTFKPLYLFLF